jgi:hypothetical protein
MAEISQMKKMNGHQRMNQGEKLELPRRSATGTTGENVNIPPCALQGDRKKKPESPMDWPRKEKQRLVAFMIFSAHKTLTAIQKLALF